ncbi:hypothetical protein [Vibrio porteresiae]|uniref:Uncharacterized protein n=1 Tax=Vibrio porteresiae DSM 19223 TaxID=1123496 RepID=A0ABZ0QHE6_9VIBR|nr:hypothetical protein [Vibrio porteresiae]WPC75859.1 hypothetical protein R8Z52_23375 [Vibrio porteresiae DSM 19223]
MFRLIILLSLLGFSLDSVSSPAGDEALFDLSIASLACAAVQHVNPKAVEGNYPNYLKNAVKTYSLYHSMPLERAEKNEVGMYNLMIGEPAIKAQKLKSVNGARAYLNKFLYKTDATSCLDTPFLIKEMLHKYGITL